LNNKLLKTFVFFLLFLVSQVLSAIPLYSPTWGFRLDLPEGYDLIEGNGLDRFSFQGPNDTKFDLAVYDGTYSNIEQMAADINRRLGNNGETAFFDYREKSAALLELDFMDSVGWGLCIDLTETGNGRKIKLLALAYAPATRPNMDMFHLSALDSIIPSETERNKPGPITEFAFPRGEQIEITITGTGLKAQFRENDAEAAQALIDREFILLHQYLFSTNWQEAWIRFYRAIYRDSYDRIANAVFLLEREFNTGLDERAFAEKTLTWVQGFKYERDLEGSDFVNLVSAITEGRGDCDSRAMLWAIILRKSNIPAAIMVSREHSHAMGLADLSGSGARFEAYGIRWLVAETTANVALGLISQEMSDSESWLAVVFE